MRTVQKTTHVRATDQEERWFLYDASEHVLGRMAVRIAIQLMGKDRPTFTPSELPNTHIVVVNAGSVRTTGRKDEQKAYRHYTGYPGGLKEESLASLRDRRPEEIVTLAVRRMLPKSRLGHDMLRCLKVYSAAEHPHRAQQPVKVEA